MLRPPPFIAGVARAVLEQLAVYRYLTAPQLLRLGVTQSRDHLWERLRWLERRGLIGRQRFGVDPNAGKMPDILWLTASGAEYVPDTIAPEGHRPQGSADIRHRVATVDMLIALRMWAAAHGWHIPWLKTDFDPGKPGHKATSVPLKSGEPYIPDAVALLTAQAGKPYPLVLEVYRGGWRNDIGHFKRQLPRLIQAADSEAVESAHAFPTLARYLLTFHTADMLRQALAALPDPRSDRWEAFFFAEHGAVVGDFVGAWRDVSGRPKRLFKTA